MRELVTTFLDALGLLLVAAGLAALTFPVLSWGCLAVAGTVVLAGSLYAHWQAQPDLDRERERAG